MGQSQVSGTPDEADVASASSGSTDMSDEKLILPSNHWVEVLGSAAHMTWAHEIATKLIEDHVGFKEDRTAFLRDITKVLLDIRTNAVFEGAAMGEHKVWGILWDILLSRAVADKAWQTFMAEQCRKFLSSLEEAPHIRIEEGAKT
jgi:hypothetical protein